MSFSFHAATNLPGSSVRLRPAVLPVAVFLLLSLGAQARPIEVLHAPTPKIPKQGEAVSEFTTAIMALAGADGGFTTAFSLKTVFAPLPRFGLGLTVPAYYAGDTSVGSVGDMAIWGKVPVYANEHFFTTMMAEFEVPSGDRRLFRYYAFRSNSVCVDPRNQFNAGTTDFTLRNLSMLGLPFGLMVTTNIGYTFTGDCKCFPGILGSYDNQLTYTATVTRYLLAEELLALMAELNGDWHDRWGQRQDVSIGARYQLSEYTSAVASVSVSVLRKDEQYYRYKTLVGYRVRW